MNNKLKIGCIDINTPYCPCALAEEDACVFCASLRKEAVCDCNWSGVCVLYEYTWQYKAGQTRPISRSEFNAPVFKKELIAKNTYLLGVKVPEKLANELTKAGAFIFLKAPLDSAFFNFPASVMKVENDVIYLVIEAAGVKTRRFLETTFAEVTVRGPYYNGILGRPWIDDLKCGKILLVAGGLGQVAAVQAAAAFKANNNEVRAVLSPGHIDKIFIADELKALGVQLDFIVAMNSPFGRNYLKEQFTAEKVPDLVLSAGPDEQHFYISRVMFDAGVNIAMAATNNAVMCCGEGVCGSCGHETESGKNLRKCKLQADFLDISN